MSNSNNHGTIEISKAVISCLGAVIAAIIGGVFLLVSVGVIQFGSPSTTITPSFASNDAKVELPSISQNKSMFAVLVGVTNETAFSLPDAMNYTYMVSVQNVDEAIVELSKVFDSNDIVYVVHVPNLRITPGNPGSCKLYLQQVERLKEYPLGWIIGGDNIVPDQFESELAFCYGQ